MMEQVNIKLDRRLLREVDSLADLLHVSRSELIRLTLAEGIKEQSLKLRESVAVEFVKGHISDTAMESLLGPDAEDIRLIKRTMARGKRIVDGLLERP